MRDIRVDVKQWLSVQLGEDFIAYTHGPTFIDNPLTRLGQIEGNPFQEAVTEAARRVN